ncbi:MAG: flagellar basal body-associated FliL family protein [Sporichthyaceae bacterium]
MNAQTMSRPADDRAQTTDTDRGAGSSGTLKKAGDANKPKFGKKRILVGAVALVGVIAGAYMLVLKPKPAAHAGDPEPGIVVKLDPLTLNLADGRYLKVAMALQFTKTASDGGGGHGGGAEEPDGSKALDIAISQLSNRKLADLNKTASREKAKAQLLKEVSAAYHHDVMDIFFTEFVMQ